MHKFNLDGLAEVIEKLQENRYTSLDLDVLDPSVFPGTGTPGGRRCHICGTDECDPDSTEVVGCDVNELSRFMIKWSFHSSSRKDYQGEFYLHCKFNRRKQEEGDKKMGKVLIVGCGGVASVAVHKMLSEQ